MEIIDLESEGGSSSSEPSQDHMQLLFVKTEPDQTIVVSRISITVASPPPFPISLFVYWRTFWESSPQPISEKSSLIGFDPNCTKRQNLPR